MKKHILLLVVLALSSAYLMAQVPITWHPYHCPETMINEDLWELFMEDYNEWYFTNKQILPEPRSPQPITNAIGFTFSPNEIKETYRDGLVLDFLQNHPQWKWLHNYINTVVENDAVTSNEALLGSVQNRC